MFSRGQGNRTRRGTKTNPRIGRVNKP